jgi:ABC-type Zn uptake system ZnuABC Zn-binding protein ZnuA
MRTRITLIVVAGVVGASLMACSGGSASSDRLAVVATTTQVGSIADEVGGDAIDLTVLLAPGAEAHDYEMTTTAAVAIEEAALVLRSGAGLEGWLDDALETISTDAALRDVSDGVELREPAAEEPAHEEEEGEVHEDEEHAVDPHYWLSGPNAIRMVENVRDALIEAVPDQAASFTERAGTLVGRLEAADVEIRAMLDEIPEANRGIVTNHDALGYFIEEYGLRFVGSIFSSLDVEAEPSAGDLAKLIDTIREEGVTAIFSDSAVNPDLSQAIAAETGAAVVETPLYTDSMGAPGSGADTLDAMLLHNASVIHDALVDR